MSPEPTVSAPRILRGGNMHEMLRELLLQGRTDQVLALVARLVATHSELLPDNWVTRAADLLQPLWQATMDALRGSKVVHLDATGLPVLDASTPGRPRLGTFWSWVGDERTAFYLYCSTNREQGALGPEDVLARCEGYVVADGSSGFGTASPRQAATACGCNLQARRYFIKARKSGDMRSINALNAFQQMYSVETEISGYPPEAKRAKRQETSKPAYDDLVRWCIDHRYEPPSSPLGRAIHYVLANEAALRRFLDDGVIPIDNGILERPHMRLALPREGHLLANSDVGAQHAAIACTLWSCCQLSDVDPIEYLADVLPRLSRGIPLVSVPELLPARWKARSVT